MYSIIELAGRRTKFIPNLLYFYYSNHKEGCPEFIMRYYELWSKLLKPVKNIKSLKKPVEFPELYVPPESIVLEFNHYK